VSTAVLTTCGKAAYLVENLESIMASAFNVDRVDDL